MRERGSRGLRRLVGRRVSEGMMGMGFQGGRAVSDGAGGIVLKV